MARFAKKFRLVAQNVGHPSPFQLHGFTGFCQSFPPLNFAPSAPRYSGLSNFENAMSLTHTSFRFPVAQVRLGGVLPCLFAAGLALANGLSTDVVGSWKMVSHTVTLDGSTFDSHAALMQQRPCAAKVRYNVNADGTYRLDASSSDCDEKYKAIQEKLYAKTRWKLEGNKITTSATNFAVGQTYAVSVSGNRMTWIGTDGQGTLVFQR